MTGVDTLEFDNGNETVESVIQGYKKELDDLESEVHELSNSITEEDINKLKSALNDFIPTEISDNFISLIQKDPDLDGINIDEFIEDLSQLEWDGFLEDGEEFSDTQLQNEIINMLRLFATPELKDEIDNYKTKSIDISGDEGTEDLEYDDNELANMEDIFAFDSVSGKLCSLFIKGIDSGNFKDGILKLDSDEIIVLSEKRADWQEESKVLQEKLNNQGYISLDDLGDYKQDVIDGTREKLENRIKDSVNKNALIENEIKNKGVLSEEFLGGIFKKDNELRKNFALYLSFSDSNGGEYIDYIKQPERFNMEFRIFIRSLHPSWKVKGINARMLSRKFKRDFELKLRNNERLKKRRSEINSRKVNAGTKITDYTPYTTYKTVSDIQNASGTQIIHDANIGEQLDKYDDTNIDDIPEDEKVNIRKEQLPIVREKFVENHSEIKDYILLGEFLQFYDPENNTVNITKEDLKMLLGEYGNEVDIDEIYSILMSFPGEMDSMVKELTTDYISDQELANSDKRIDTAGFILDNIKSLFGGFTYDEKEPVTIQGDMLIIKGSITGSKTKIRYDLKNGDLYMNSFVNESDNPPVITVGEHWNKSEDYPEANSKIGSIGSFGEILSYADIFTEDEVEEEQEDYLDEALYPNYIKPPISNIPMQGGFIPKSDSVALNDIGLVHKKNIDETYHNIEHTSFNKRKMSHGNKKGNSILSRLGGFERSDSQQRQAPSSRPGPRPAPGRLPGPGMSTPFDIHINDFIEKNPKLQSKLNTTFDLIGKQVKNYSEIQSKKNSIITEFLKTFNVMNTQNNVKSMQFREGSKIYNVLHIIEKNSDYNELNQFLGFMEDISKYSGLQWGSNNLPEQQANKCYKEIVDANIYDRESARGCLKKSLMNFKTETLNLGDPNNLDFDSKRQLGIAELIIDNIVDYPKDVAKSKFDTTKINNFLKSLKTGEEINNEGLNLAREEDDPDKTLEESLNNI